MKKHLVSIVMIIFSCHLIFAQVAYKDAADLRKYIQQSGTKYTFQGLPGDTRGFIEILKKYVEPAERDNIKNSRDLYDYFNGFDNSFLTEYLNSGGSVSAIGDPTVPTAESISGLTSGGINVTNIADGLSKFLVERAKEELSIAFFDRLKKAFKNYPEFELLFPNTKENLLIIESYNFSGYLSILRTGFLKDINNLTVNIAKIEDLNADIDCKGATNDKCKDRINRYKTFFSQDKGNLFKVTLTFIEEFKKGSNPSELLNTIANNTDFYNLTDKNYLNVKSTVQLADFISQSFLSLDEERTWVPFKDVKELIKDKPAFSIYLGLLYQLKASEDIKFKIDSQSYSFRSILKKAKETDDKITEIKRYIENMTNDLDRIDTAINKFKKLKQADEKPDNADYFRFYDGLVSLISDASDFQDLNLGVSFNLEQKKKLKQFVELANVSGNIYEDITSKNYSSAIMNIRIMFQKTELVEREFFNEFIKYGTFMASVAEAENSDQVKGIIESIALPAGSSSIKRTSKENFSLNAYLGAAYGEEYNGETNTKKNIAGISAPIGIAYSRGLSYRGKNCNCDRKELGSVSLFVSVIDLGAVTNFRLNDSETEELPEIKLENLFAPGAYLVYGIPKWPLSIGAGAQYGPQLREVTTMNNISENPSFSVRFFLAIDIPLLNFYTKSR